MKNQKKAMDIVEWSESYIVYKLFSDERIGNADDKEVHVADGEMNPINGISLKILIVMRKDNEKKIYRYFTGPTVRIGNDDVIIHNGSTAEQFGINASKIWATITNKKDTTFSDENIVNFLQSIFVNRFSASPKHTTDLTIEAHSGDGITRKMGFSCKSDIDAVSTLFNASLDNTDFEYEVTGGMTDLQMEEFNNLVHKVSRKGVMKEDVVTADRMKYLKSHKFDIRFVGAVGPEATRNLIISGGREMPEIVGALLKYYYFVHEGSTKDNGADFRYAIKYLSQNNAASYDFPDLEEVYKAKVATMLYNMFTGMRLGSRWNGKGAVDGGYIVVKRDGSIVAYHSCIADEFKDFLVSKLKFEAPSAVRHKDRMIEKRDGKYYLKLALQVRFKLKS